MQGSQLPSAAAPKYLLYTNRKLHLCPNLHEIHPFHLKHLQTQLRGHLIKTGALPCCQLYRHLWRTVLILMICSGNLQQHSS